MKQDDDDDDGKDEKPTAFLLLMNSIYNIETSYAENLITENTIRLWFETIANLLTNNCPEYIIVSDHKNLFLIKM